ncbi:MAG: isoprenylcysteine carboxylmethyltransferase family protein [Planctomycetota bacterium]|nr:isoprenylcysteine carboxylmethyltransferase family protein [Planctomycetota bacterium]
MSRIFGLLYGVICYAIGMGAITYLIFFLGGVFVPRTLDGGQAPALGVAVAVNVALLLLFALQHSVMPRRRFKTWLTRVVPPSCERSTYVLASGLALIVLYVGWQPMPGVVWSVEHEALRVALYILQGLGWTVLVAATFMLSHWELFGLAQVWAHVRGRSVPGPTFRMPGFYRHVRHPIQLGVLLGIWITPDMSAGRLLFCVAMTMYILAALVFLEEPDLVREFGDTYRRYRHRAGMLLPKFGGRATSSDGAARPAARP